MRRATWLLFALCGWLTTTAACNAKRALNAQNDGATSDADATTDAAPPPDARGDADVATCPAGYPYCPTIDACLLPGRTCPPAAGDAGDGPATASDAAASDADASPLPDDALPLMPSTPNEIRCGGNLCGVQGYCCSSNQDAGVSGSTFEICSDTFCGYRRECDESADCVGDEVCCYSVVASPPAVLASTCTPRSQCAYDGAWIGCGNQEDCRSVGAPACVAQACAGTTIQSCGPISRFACKNH